MLGFERQRNPDDFATGSFALIQHELTSQEIERFKRIRRNWNFYEGYHWEDYPDQDGVELTVNYCRAFVDKITAFELGKAFSFTTRKDYETVPVSTDEEEHTDLVVDKETGEAKEQKVTRGRTLFEYLEDVWEDNNQYKFCTDMGQMKSVTGEAWVQVHFYAPEELNDVYGKYPNGRISLMLMPTDTIWPEYDPHDRNKLTTLTVMYTYKRYERKGILSSRRTVQDVLYKQVWTDEKCVIYDEDMTRPVDEFENPYGIIPFVCIPNVSVACRTEGTSDLEDIIPLNTEYNMKASDVSEIIDYHASPVTVVYGAKVGNLEKGANKMWGGLAKDARVENLEMASDLSASLKNLEELKQSMCEVGGVPETVLGGAKAISNTSGVALAYMNLPLIEKCARKKQATEDGLERLNALILRVSFVEGFITIPQEIPVRDFYFTDVDLPDTLPKDELLELQRIQVEMKCGLECREGAMRRLGKENITELMKKIDEDVKAHPEFYGLDKATEENDITINSGFTNGQTPVEEVRKEITGQNGGGRVI